MISWVASKISGNRDIAGYEAWIIKITEAAHRFLDKISNKQFSDHNEKSAHDIELKRLIHELDQLLQEEVLQSTIKSVYEKYSHRRKVSEAKDKDVGHILLLLINLIVGYLSTSPNRSNESALLLHLLHRYVYTSTGSCLI